MSGLTWRVDMHLHTYRSFDCRNRPHRILEAARNRGLDRIIVTDHNEIDGALELQSLDPERVIVGEEVKTAEGFDVIGIFLTDLIPRRTPARETCERILAQGGVVYLPHPFDSSRADGMEPIGAIADLVDVVEVHNARCFPAALNDRAQKWAASLGKAMGAGSDAHTLAEIGRGFVEVPAFENERGSLLTALEHGRIQGTNTSPAFRLASNYAKLRNAISRIGTR